MPPSEIRGLTSRERAFMFSAIMWVNEMKAEAAKG